MSLKAFVKGIAGHHFSTSFSRPESNLVSILHPTFNRS